MAKTKKRPLKRSKPTPKRSSVVDETSAMAVIASALEGLDQDALDRVLDWTERRFRDDCVIGITEAVER